MDDSAPTLTRSPKLGKGWGGVDCNEAVTEFWAASFLCRQYLPNFVYRLKLYIK